MRAVALAVAALCAVGTLHAAPAAKKLELDGRTYTRSVRSFGKGCELVSIRLGGLKFCEVRMAVFDLKKNPKLEMHFRYGPAQGRMRAAPDVMAQETARAFKGKALAAINGDFFLYEKDGKPARPFGVTFEDGKLHEVGCWGPNGYPIVARLKDGTYAFGKLTSQIGATTNLFCDGKPVSSAIRVWNRPLVDGKKIPSKELNCYPDDDQKIYPRTFVGLGPNRIVFLVADARQPLWSWGLTSAEASELLLREGCTDSGQFDGGGSTALWANGEYANRPSDGKPRPVANGLVVIEKKK